MLFLDSVLEKQREEERLRKEMEGEELKHFRECVICLSSSVRYDSRYTRHSFYTQGGCCARKRGQQAASDWCCECGE